MSISVFDIFSIGIGPSSSHTVGPMKAANEFLKIIDKNNLLPKVDRVKIELYGSLALTGKGHATDRAILNGLEGFNPETVEPTNMVPRMEEIINNKIINLASKKEIKFNETEDLVFYQKEILPKHTNGLILSVYDNKNNQLFKETYYSIGGGFILTAEEFENKKEERSQVPLPFNSGKELLSLCKENNISISELMFENEKSWFSVDEIQFGIKKIASVMEQCIENGCHHSGTLPGGLHVKRRAPNLYKKITANEGIKSKYESADIMNRLNMYAIAVNEENAAGGRIVTSPTNGAAGIIPAVLKYYQEAYNRFQD